MKPFLLLSLLFFSLQVLPAEIPSHVATTPVARPEPAWQDWHASFNEIAQKGEAQLVFLGDSITRGWGGKGAAAWEKFFADLKAANFGIGGDRTEHVLWRLNHGNLDGLSPRLIVLMIGTNNTGHQGREGYDCTPQQTAEGVKRILATIKDKCPESKVLLLAIFPRGETPADPMRRQNDKINEIIQGYADGKSVYWMNLASVFLEDDGRLDREIMPDLLHLSEKGYELWAKALLPEVKRLLK